MTVVAPNIIKRDGTCRMTNYTEQTEAAHIIPDGESEWFCASGMTCRATMTHSSNFLLLRVDVHKLWDQRQFTIVPRTVDEQQAERTDWVTYVLKRHPPAEVINLYHDVSLQPITGIDVLFLFCRFAWTIFESLDIFLEQGSARWLMVRNPMTGSEEAAQFSSNKCRDQNFTRRGRTQSPKKAKRAASNEEEIEDADEGRYFWGSGSSAYSGRSSSPGNHHSSPESSDGEPSRGRKRRRSDDANIARELYLNHSC